MTHIKKQWVFYLSVIVAIYFTWKWLNRNLVTGTSNRAEGSACTIDSPFGVAYTANGFWKNGVCTQSTTSNFFKPVDSNGNCPEGWFHASGMRGESLGCTPVQIYS